MNNKMKTIQRNGATSTVFYGWWIVLTGFILILFSTGIFNFITFRQIRDFLTKELNASINQVAIIFSFLSLFGLIASLVFAPLIDKYGPKRIMLIVIPLFGIGIMGLSFANSLAIVYIQCILTGIGFYTGFQLPIQTATANWFIKRRCIALALISTAPVISKGIKDFFGDWLINQIDFQTGLLVLGILVLIIGIPLGFVFRHRPEQYGYLPDGLSPKSAELINKPENHFKEINFSLVQALKTRAFWMLSLAIALGIGSSLITNFNLKPLLMNQGYEIDSANVLSNIMHLFGLVGILIFGYLGDKFPKRYLLALAVTFKSLSIFIPVITNNSAMVYLYFFLAGLGDGVTPLFLAIRADYFGRKAFATITVVMIFIRFFPISFIVGLLPILLSRNQLFPIIIVLSGLVAAIVFFFTTPPEQPQQALA